MKEKNQLPGNKKTRREFITNLSKASAAGMLLAAPFWSFESVKTWTVGEIMDLFLDEIDGAPFPETVDTLKSGNRDMEVSGIITTMFATIPVIKYAVSVGANFIIAHEPTFYNHFDNAEWLENDATYQYKSKLLKDNNIAVWRNHDYIHSHKPDGVYSMLLEKLWWKPLVKGEVRRPLIDIPPVTLSELVKQVKEKLGIKMLRYVGDESQICSKALVLPGAMGGENQIRLISQHEPDVVLIGEAEEWTTPEYIRDSIASGKKISLIVLGHSDSEDPGSIYMKDWMLKNVPGIEVTHLASGNPFRFG